MPTPASVFAYATPGQVEEAEKTSAGIEGVKSRHACWDRPDVIACVEAPNDRALGQLVLQTVPRAAGIEVIDTRILVEV
jgi:hypothetical protein